MPSYRTAEPEILALLADVMKQHHGDLVEAGVTIEVFTAHAKRDRNGAPKGPALKHHGTPALGTIRITSEEERIAGRKDAVMKLDGDEWPELPPEQQASLLDHEATHLLLVRDKEGNIELDDCFRPKLKMRPHDAELGLFYQCVERHGMNAVETKAYLPVHKKFTQLLLPYG
jgi:hypothetical protein